ncbi:hypothetical protein SM914_03470, partial [Escherichia coli]|nr:hypothetical protein [Escherichia coli]
MLFITFCHGYFARKNVLHLTSGGDDAAKQVIPTASQCKIGTYVERGNDSNLLIVFYVQIMPDDLVM